MKKLMSKLFLFSNAFLLMSVLMCVKLAVLVIFNSEYKNNIAYIGLSVLSVFILFGFFGIRLLMTKPDSDYQNYKIKKINNVTGDYYFGYFSLFVLLFVEFDFNSWFNLASFVFVMIILCVVYCRNDLYYMNATANVFGYRIYKVEAESLDKDKANFDGLVISTKEIQISKEYKIYVNDKNYCWIEKIDND